MKKHTGSCHCKKVQYEVDLDLTQPAIECNCSHCSAKGLLLQAAPASAFELKSGEDALKEYRFNTNKIQHQFCEECGTQSFARGKNKEGEDTLMINIRTIDGVNLDEIVRQPFDGKSH